MNIRRKYIHNEVSENDPHRYPGKLGLLRSGASHIYLHL